MKTLNTSKALRYNKCRIDFIPSDAFPEMVQITKTPKRLKQFIGKKYITLDKAKIAIDYRRTMLSISNVGSVKSTELESVVIMDE